MLARGDFCDVVCCGMVGMCWSPAGRIVRVVVREEICSCKLALSKVEKVLVLEVVATAQPCLP